MEWVDFSTRSIAPSLSSVPKIYLLLSVCLLSVTVRAQKKSSLADGLKFAGDFRFRLEQDWDSQKADGSQRQDRSRLRYRVRFGFQYQASEHYSFGARVRNGQLNDQQGPHTTLGNEFGLIQLGLEKLYFQARKGIFQVWVGKNDFPFHKTNELFWNDNVFPDGGAIKLEVPTNSNPVEVNLAHFIILSNNAGFRKDAYFQGVQVVNRLYQNKLLLFPGFYYFHQVSNIPDNKGTFALDYAILHLGTQFKSAKKPFWCIGADYYQNLNNLSKNSNLESPMDEQKQGVVCSLTVGRLKEKGDWSTAIYLARIEKYAIVDYFAQNDWARWDYSSYDAAGSRLSNFKGIELRAGYALTPKANLILRMYTVRQLISLDNIKEDGNRARIDLNIKL